MRTYVIDISNSNSGPIGCCAYVKAHSKKEALENFRARVGTHLHELPKLDDDLEAIRIYFNPAKITLKNVRLCAK